MRRPVALALILAAAVAAGYLGGHMPHPLDSSSDPASDLARSAMPGGQDALRKHAHERRIRQHHARGRVDGMVFRTQYAEALDEVSTASTTAVDLGGPSVTVTIPEGGGIVEIYVEVDGKVTGTTGDVYLVATDIPGGSEQILHFATAGYTTRSTVQGSNAGQLKGLGGPLRFYAPTPGEETFSLQYLAESAGTVFFQNRRLWVGVARAGT